MKKIYNWITSNKFEAYSLAFMMMIIPSALFFPGAQNDALGLIWILLGVIFLANLFVLTLK